MRSQIIFVSLHQLKKEVSHTVKTVKAMNKVENFFENTKLGQTIYGFVLVGLVLGLYYFVSL